MKKKEIGEFLYRFYKKRTASFLANIYKASITGESVDIHRARLDVKKIFALYGLFEMLDPAAFNKEGGYKLFRGLFRQAGKIREIQVNYLVLQNYKVTHVSLDAFIAWLREEEHRAVLKFMEQVKKFREKELESTDKKIQKICNSSSIVKLRSKTKTYIQFKAAKVYELNTPEPSDRDIHKIRQHLKSISTIATLVYSIKPGKQLDSIITQLNKSEMMIGDWHDRVVLKETVERFIVDAKSISASEQKSLINLQQMLIEDNQNLVMHFMPEVTAIVMSILNEDEHQQKEKGLES